MATPGARLGLIAHVPNEKPRFVPVSVDLLSSLSLAEVAGAVRRALCATFNYGSEEEESMRVLYKERDLDDEGPAAALLRALQPGGMPCTVRVLFRLLGGKGGFGALLRKQGKATRKTTNFDAQRDLSGRRIRHAKAVERIKEWMEEKKRDDDLVKLITGEGPDLPQAPDPNATLDPEYVRKLKRAGANKSDLVSAALQRREEDGEASVESVKRLRRAADEEATSAGRSSESSWISALDTLGSPSSPVSGGDSDEDAAKAKPSCSASSSGGGPVAGASASAAAAASEEAKDDDEDDEDEEEASDGEHEDNAANGEGKREEEEPVKRNRKCRGSKAPSESERLAVSTQDGEIVRPEDLANYGNAEELVNSVDAEDLKRSLQLLGMKCGGSPRERAARLFMLKLTPLKDLPKSVLAPKK